MNFASTRKNGVWSVFLRVFWHILRARRRLLASVSGFTRRLVSGLGWQDSSPTAANRPPIFRKIKSAAKPRSDPTSSRWAWGRSLVGGEQREGEVLGGGGTVARGFFEGGVAAVGGIVGLFAVEDLLNGEDLQAGIGAIPVRAESL